MNRIEPQAPGPFTRDLWLQILQFVDWNSWGNVSNVSRFFRTCRDRFIVRCNVRTHPLDQQCLQELSHWPNLEVVDLRFRLVTAEFIQGLKVFPRVERLVLDNCEGVDAGVIDAVGQGCPLLKCLELNGTSAPGDRLIDLAEQLVHLERLSLVDCAEVSSAHIGKMMERRSTLQFSISEGVYFQNHVANKILIRYVQPSQTE